MLVALIDVISCENPRCRDFAKIVPEMRGVMSYYCPICANISFPRTVDAVVAASPKNFKDYLQQELGLVEVMSTR